LVNIRHNQVNNFNSPFSLIKAFIPLNPFENANPSGVSSSAPSKELQLLQQGTTYLSYVILVLLGRVIFLL
jgi:hypothetical protein